MKKLTMVMTAVSLSALLLAGCGDTDNTNESTEVTEEAAQTAETETAEEKVYPDDSYMDSLNVNDYVTLGDYMGLEVSVTKVNVTDTQVEDYISGTLASHKENKEITGRAAQDGDVTNIDYVGKKDGVAFEGGTAEGQELILGSGRFIEGFEEGVVGMKVGETKDLNLTFPEVYTNEELAGAEVVFTVTLNGIYEKVTPEFNDAFVAGLAIENVATVDEYRQYVYDNLLAQDQNRYEAEVQNEVLKAVCENATFSQKPEAMIERYYDRLVSNMTYQAAMYGLDMETFMLYLTGMTAEDYEAEMKASAEEAVEQILALQAIAEKEGMTVSDDEMEKDIVERAIQFGYESGDAYKEALGNEVKGYREMLMTENMTEFLVKNAKITDIEPETKQIIETEETAETEEAVETEETAESEETAAE